MLYIDVAKAYTHGGKHDRAFESIRTAGHFAPEEVRARPAVHRVLYSLLRDCPTYPWQRVRRYAQAAGALA